MGERLHRRRQNDVRGAHRGGDRRRGLGGVRVALGHQGQHGIGARPASLTAEPLAETERRRVGDDEDVLARGHPQAVVDDSGDRALEVGWTVHPSDPRR